MRKNESADILVRSGFDVEQNPLTVTNKTPDYKIDGEIFDCYSPSGSNPRSIWSNAKSKIDSGQTNSLVINLQDSDVEFSALKNQFESYAIPELQKLLIITKKR